MTGTDHVRPPGSAAPRPPRVPSQLRLRIASGLAVGTIAVAMTVLGAIPFIVLLAGVAVVMAWEWGTVVRANGRDTGAALHGAAMITAAILMLFDGVGLALGVVFGTAAFVTLLLMSTGRGRLSGIGVLYTGLPLIALAWLRRDEPLGLMAVLFVLTVVAVTDTAAYAAGKTIGGAKLWPAVSPGKTWAGLCGGVSAAALTGLAFAWIASTGSAVWLAGLAGLLAVIAQGGDLAESALKRRFGLKDASDLIPGHGGFMDRMDGVVTASVAAALIALAIDAYAPARAVLHGS